MASSSQNSRKASAIRATAPQGSFCWYHVIATVNENALANKNRAEACDFGAAVGKDVRIFDFQKVIFTPPKTSSGGISVIDRGSFEEKIPGTAAPVI